MYHPRCHPVVYYLLSIEVYGRINLISIKPRGDFHLMNQIPYYFHVSNENSFHDYQLQDTHLNLLSMEVSSFDLVYLFFGHQRAHYLMYILGCIGTDYLVCDICLCWEVEASVLDMDHFELADNLVFDTHRCCEVFLVDLYLQILQIEWR